MKGTLTVAEIRTLRRSSALSLQAPPLFGRRRPRAWVLTVAAEPGPFGGGHVVVASPVHTLDALVPIDDLENLTDECARLLSSILGQRGGEEESSGPHCLQGTPCFPKHGVRRLRTHA